MRAILVPDQSSVVPQGSRGFPDVRLASRKEISLVFTCKAAIWQLFSFSAWVTPFLSCRGVMLTVAGMFPAMSGQSITAGSSKSPIKPMLPLMPHMPFCMPQQHCYVEQGAPLKQGGGSMQQEQLAPVVAADDDDAVFDEDVEVEEETWRLFEKVAAMERAKVRSTSSPC
jgi:hypothetical protein